MGLCLKCNFLLKEGVIECPQCGENIIARDATRGAMDQVGGERNGNWLVSLRVCIFCGS